MGDPGYVVRGKGDEHSLNSASHGADRIMSRTAAFKSISEERLKDYLAERGIALIGGSVDEALMAYKEIETVVGLQGDLVGLVRRFTSKIVRPWTPEANPGTKRSVNRPRRASAVFSTTVYDEVSPFDNSTAISGSTRLWPSIS
jgi:hypothetical protein